MCNCTSMCWDPAVITDNGRWPMPDHHPNCEDYRAEKFISISYDGTQLTMEVDEAEDFMQTADAYGDSPEYQTEEVFITRHQFDSLPEGEF